ncbi:MAG: TlpA family protein disulfide reductase [Acidimicrobiales bacterium]
MLGSRRRRTVALATMTLLVICFAVAAGLLAASGGPGGEPNRPTATLAVFDGAGPTAAQLRLPRLGGGHFSLAILGHGPFVVNFFASWCHACQAELSAVAAVARQHHVAFYGVDTNETSFSAARHLLKESGARYPVGIGGTAPAFEYRDDSGLPATGFVDAKGHLVGEAFGAVTESELAGWVAELDSGRRLTP